MRISALSTPAGSLFRGRDTKGMHTDNMTTMHEYIDQLLAEMQPARLEALDNSFKARPATLPVKNQVAL